MESIKHKAESLRRKEGMEQSLATNLFFAFSFLPSASDHLK
jgi:hypothetical protein